MMTDSNKVEELEGSIHEQLRLAVQGIADRYGICINAVVVDWLNVSTVDKQRYVMSEIRVTTDYRCMYKP